MTLRAVAFDLGETLVDETRMWSEWRTGSASLASRSSVPWGGLRDRACRTRRCSNASGPTGSIWRPNALPDAPPAGPDTFTPGDLYPDARPCLEELRRRGYRVAIAGNQSAETAEVVRSFDLPVDLDTNSGELGAEKPSPEFYRRLAEALDAAPGEMAYVGDRVDNDVLPALAAGMVAVFIRRGPWGFLQAERVPAEALRIDTLAELPDALGPLR